MEILKKKIQQVDQIDIVENSSQDIWIIILVLKTAIICQDVSYIYIYI